MRAFPRTGSNVLRRRVLFLAQGPENRANDLRGADGAGEVGAVVQAAHEGSPGRGTGVPGHGVALRVNQSHDAIADEGHGGEVFPAFRSQEHDGASAWLEAVSGLGVAGVVTKRNLSRCRLAV